MVEEAVMSTVTQEQVLHYVAALGPLQNVFLVGKDNGTLGLPIIWYPEIGLRYAVIENDVLAQAVYAYLRDEAKVRRFDTERQVSEAMFKEKWEGWDTCEDSLRMRRATEALSKKGTSGPTNNPANSGPDLLSASGKPGMFSQQEQVRGRKQRCFVLRIAPNRIDRVQDALDADELIIGWSALPQLLDANLSWQAFRELIHAKYYSQKPNYRSSGLAAGSLWRFIREMNIHDIVVVPHGPEFYVASVRGPACHRPKKINEGTAFRRPVEWLNDKQPIPRCIGRVALQSRLKVQGTCADATDLLEEIQQLVRRSAKGATPSFEEDLRTLLIRDTLKEIRSDRIDNVGFERFLAGLLSSLGAKTVRVVPRSQDKGADLVAKFITANTFEFTLAVQAKHWQPLPPVEREVIDQLLRGMEAEDADLGWVATSGTFSEDAVEYATELREEEGRRLELVDGELLASLIVEAGVTRDQRSGG
jgi:predicted Mrr-cat superfamily restriction endonuclease